MKAALIRLTLRGVSFQWFDECEERFENLKTLMTSLPILNLPEDGVDFSLYCDTSGVRLGSILMQNAKVIAYSSR